MQHKQHVIVNVLFCSSWWYFFLFVFTGKCVVRSLRTPSGGSYRWWWPSSADSHHLKYECYTVADNLTEWVGLFYQMFRVENSVSFPREKIQYVSFAFVFTHSCKITLYCLASLLRFLLIILKGINASSRTFSPVPDQQNKHPPTENTHKPFPVFLMQQAALLWQENKSQKKNSRGSVRCIF